MSQKKKSPLAFKLLGVKIRKLHFQAIQGVPTEETTNLQIILGHDFNYIGKEKKLFVLMTIDIFGEEAPIKLELEFEGVFLLNRRATKTEVEPFASINCSAILFPYVRETIAEITRRAGYAPLHLGSMNFVEAFKSRKNKA